MHDDWSLVTELFLGLVYLADQLNEPLAARRHALFRPVRELKLSYRPTLAVLHHPITITTTNILYITYVHRCSKIVKSRELR